jgi:hypothetical protein
MSKSFSVANSSTSSSDANTSTSSVANTSTSSSDANSPHWNDSRGVDSNGVPRRMCAPMAGGEDNDVQKFTRAQVGHMLELASNMEQIQRMQNELNVRNRENIVRYFMNGQ